TAACADFGMPDLAYAINFSGASEGAQNFYRGNRTLEHLMSLQEPELPVLSMWTGPGVPVGYGERQMSTIWDGVIVAGWRFVVAIKGLRSTGLVDLCEATEAAMIATLAPEFSRITYRGDLSWQGPPELKWVDEDAEHVGWIQEIEFQASFRV